MPKRHVNIYAKKRIPRSAFTLVELLVVIAIIAVLAAVAFFSMRSISAKGDSAKCLSKLRNLYIATVAAKNENDGKFPAFKVYGFDANAYMSTDATAEWHNLPAPPSIGEVLAPYLGLNATSTMNILPSSMPEPFCCPAAKKNKRKSWINASCAYRYNAYAIGRMTISPNAMLFIDTAWPDWPKADFSHQSPGPCVNLIYADGHSATMDYATYLSLNPSSGSEYQKSLFKTGWLE